MCVRVLINIYNNKTHIDCYNLENSCTLFNRLWKRSVSVFEQFSYEGTRCTRELIFFIEHMNINFVFE